MQSQLLVIIVILFCADSVTTNGKSNTHSLKGAYIEAKLQLEKEEQELERSFSDIAQVKVI